MLQNKNNERAIAAIIEGTKASLISTNLMNRHFGLYDLADGLDTMLKSLLDYGNRLAESYAKKG